MIKALTELLHTQFECKDTITTSYNEKSTCLFITITNTEFTHLTTAHAIQDFFKALGLKTNQCENQHAINLFIKLNDLSINALIVALTLYKDA